MDVIRPRNLEEALAARAEGGAALRPIAGGTDLLVHWPRQKKRNLRFMDLTPLRATLAPYEMSETTLRLGAMTTYWDVIMDAAVSAAFPLLREAALEVGAVQIQTRGTWAGNIANASPAADGVPVLMAYDAEVVLRSTQGERRVKLDSFYSGYKKMDMRPDELIVAIELPRRARSMEWWKKVGTRSAQSIAKVGVALVRDETGTHLVASAVGPTILRCRAMEAAIEAGTKFNSPAEILELLDKDIAPIDDIRSTGKYRRTALSRLLYHQLNVR